MFGFNWTKAGQGGGGEPPPPGHYRLFGVTALAVVVMYAGIGLLFILFLMGNPSRNWPALFVMATPFISVLGAWKLIVWFGFKRVALVALSTAIAGTLSHPLWFPPTFGKASASTHDDWVGTFVILCGFSGWLMAGAALIIGPVRPVVDWFRRRNAKSCSAPPKRGGS